MITGAVWTDVNGDGWMDLMLTQAWGPVRLFVNNNGTSLEEQTREAGLNNTHGFWNGITGTDVDGDGDMDYVVTNLGENTRYEASKEHPFKLYFDDFNWDGDRELIEAYWQNDTLYPFRFSTSLYRATPEVFHSFESIEEFGNASLKDLYSREALDTAQDRSIHQLSSVVLRNRGQGRFEIERMPADAQLAPGFGTVVSAFDDQPGGDAFIAQNFFSPRPDTGRMDGGIGLLLSGAGDRAFTPVSAATSGVSIGGDMMAAARADVNGDGRPDLVVSRNNRRPVLLTRRNTGERPLQIRLSSNESGDLPGTRIAVKDGERWLRVREIYAGGGYLSQSGSSTVVRVPKGTEEVTVQVRWSDGTTDQKKIPEPEGKQITIRKQ